MSILKCIVSVIACALVVHCQNITGCVDPNHVCVESDNCQSISQEVEQAIETEICGYSKDVAQVCCNKTAVTLPWRLNKRNKFDDYCQNYILALQRKSLPPKIHVVSNGKLASPATFLYMAAIGYGNKNSITWDCAGVLISKQHILTAAHCLYKVGVGEAKYVRLGVKMISPTAIGENEQRFRISDIIGHPDYKPPAHYHDIGLVKIDRPAKFNIHVRPVCLHTKEELPEIFQVAGWGEVKPQGRRSEVLRWTELKLFNVSECNAKVSPIKNRQYPHGIMKDVQVCAGDDITRSDTCNGDSGGPLEIESDILPLPYVVGITSSGLSCAYPGTPGVYTRIYLY